MVTAGQSTRGLAVDLALTAMLRDYCLLEGDNPLPPFPPDPATP
jgi:hypothetical protein